MSLVRFRFWAYGVLAQLVEHLTFNQVVRGSIPDASFSTVFILYENGFFLIIAIIVSFWMKKRFFQIYNLKGCPFRFERVYRDPVHLLCRNIRKKPSRSTDMTGGTFFCMKGRNIYIIESQSLQALIQAGNQVLYLPQLP